MGPVWLGNFLPFLSEPSSGPCPEGIKATHAHVLILPGRKKHHCHRASLPLPPVLATPPGRPGLNHLSREGPLQAWGLEQPFLGQGGAPLVLTSSPVTGANFRKAVVSLDPLWESACWCSAGGQGQKQPALLRSSPAPMNPRASEHSAPAQTPQAAPARGALDLDVFGAESPPPRKVGNRSHGAPQLSPGGGFTSPHKQTFSSLAPKQPWPSSHGSVRLSQLDERFPTPGVSPAAPETVPAQRGGAAPYTAPPAGPAMLSQDIPGNSGTMTT